MIDRRKFNTELIDKLPTSDDLLDEKYGKKGTISRDEFDAKAQAWYYAEILREERKERKITQTELAERIGKKREYISMLERGETDMQLSTFLNISMALGLRWELKAQ